MKFKTCIVRAPNQKLILAEIVSSKYIGHDLVALHNGNLKVYGSLRSRTNPTGKFVYVEELDSTELSNIERIKSKLASIDRLTTYYHSHLKENPDFSLERKGLISRKQERFEFTVFAKYKMIAKKLEDKLEKMQRLETYKMDSIKQQTQEFIRTHESI